MPTLSFSGSINPRPGTVHVIGTVAVAGAYVWSTDLGQMRNGDEIELRFAAKPQSGTLALGYFGNYAHEQTTQIIASTPVVTNYGQISIKQTSGASTRFFSFEVWSI